LPPEAERVDQSVAEELIVWNVLASVVLVDVTQDRSVEDGFTEPVDFVARAFGGGAPSSPGP
jgi:hypothetical protein